MKVFLLNRTGVLVIFFSFILNLPGIVCADTFVTNSSLNEPRGFQSATLLLDGRVLITGGIGTNNSLGQAPLASAELYDPATGRWTPTGPMSIGRQYFTTTLLPNGKVLAAGGYGTTGTNTAELYDPSTGTWTPTGSLLTKRYTHAAVLLPSGKVLVAGGTSVDTNNHFQLPAAAELYDPVSGSWTATGAMQVPRQFHTLTLLPNGKVMAIGGVNQINPIASVESYDPLTGLWTTNYSLNIARLGHTATLLPNGQVLVTGGNDTNYNVVASAELFDPLSGTWNITNSMNVSRTGHTSTLLPNGNVLVAGASLIGYSVPAVDNSISTEIYSPTTGGWSQPQVQSNYFPGGTATLLANGQVLIAGGQNSSAIQQNSSGLYNFTTGSFLTNAPLHIARGPTTGILLPTGKAIVVGGWDASRKPLASTELFDPITKTWTNGASMATARSGNTLTLLPNGKILAVGGADAKGKPLNSVEIYDPVADAWTNAANLGMGRIEPVSILLPTGKVLVAAGQDTNLASSAIAEIYNPTDDTWSRTGSLHQGRVVSAATLLADGRVLITGGIVVSNLNIIASAELYDPATGSWTITTPLHTARDHHTATLLPNGTVLVAGGDDTNELDLASAEIYNPATGTWTIVKAMNETHSDHTATLLPDGKVLIAGGSSVPPFVTNIVVTGELYDPATGTWAATSPVIDFARSLHTAVLLTNGEVLLAGDLNTTSSTELFDSGLGYSNSWQPQIISVTSPLNIARNLALTGGQFRGVSDGSSGGAADSPTDHPVVQLRSLESSRMVNLSSTNWSTNSFVSLPVTNFPPGQAMVTIFVNGVPSVANIVNVSVPVPTAAALTNMLTVANGGFQFGFTNAPGAIFGVLASANPSLPITNWTAIGGVQETSPGHFQFTDPQAASNPQRFYLLRAP